MKRNDYILACEGMLAVATAQYIEVDQKLVRLHAVADSWLYRFCGKNIQDLIQRRIFVLDTECSRTLQKMKNYEVEIWGQHNPPTEN